MAIGLYVSMNFWNAGHGGGAEHARQITKHLTELGERIIILTPLRPGDTDADLDEVCGYTVVRFNTKVDTGEWLTPLFYRRLMLLDILKVARGEKADYLLFDACFSFLGGLSVGLAAKILKIPLIAISHHYSEPFEHGGNLPWKMKFARKFLLRSASVNLCVSNYTAGEVEKLGARPHTIHVIHPGLDIRAIESFRSDAKRFPSLDAVFPTGQPTILTVCRLESRKGVHKVIEAMPRIVSEIPDARYVVVGDGSYRDYLTRLAYASLAKDAITFLGYLTMEEKFECYRRCDIFAMPSEEEGFGMVFLEANAFGKPVVGGDIGGIRDAVVHEKTGLLVDPLNTGEIANAIVRLLTRPIEAHRLGDNGKRRAESEFTWDAIASRILLAIRDATEERN